MPTDLAQGWPAGTGSSGGMLAGQHVKAGHSGTELGSHAHI